MRLAIILLLAALYLCAPAAWAAEYRYTGNVVRVIDGDSLIIDVPDWPAPFRPARVRVTGVNAPESRRGQAKCEIERELGKAGKRPDAPDVVF